MVWSELGALEGEAGGSDGMAASIRPSTLEYRWQEKQVLLVSFHHEIIL